MMPRPLREPCLCGDPECRRCFPRWKPKEETDDAYDRSVAREVNMPEAEEHDV